MSTATETVTPDADTITDVVITVPLADAIEAFTAVLPHASKDDVTPVLTCVQLSVQDDGKIAFVATDRYTVGRFRTEGEGEPETKILLPREAAEWVAKITVKSLRYAADAPYRVTVTEHDKDEITVAISSPTTSRIERSQSFKHPGTLNFPPVDRLFPAGDFLIGPATALAPAHLVKLTTYAAKYHRTQPIKFFGTLNPESTEYRGEMLAPLLARIGKLDALIQPNLLAS